LGGLTGLKFLSFLIKKAKWTSEARSQSFQHELKADIEEEPMSIWAFF